MALLSAADPSGLSRAKVRGGRNRCAERRGRNRASWAAKKTSRRLRLAVAIPV